MGSRNTVPLIIIASVSTQKMIRVFCCINPYHFSIEVLTCYISTVVYGQDFKGTILIDIRDDNLRSIQVRNKKQKYRNYQLLLNTLMFALISCTTELLQPFFPKKNAAMYWWEKKTFLLYLTITYIFLVSWSYFLEQPFFPSPMMLNALPGQEYCPLYLNDVILTLNSSRCICFLQMFLRQHHFQVKRTWLTEHNQDTGWIAGM